VLFFLWWQALNLNQIKVKAGINVNLIFGHAKVFLFICLLWMCYPRCCFICIEESPTQSAGKWGNLCAATLQFGIPFVVCCLLLKPPAKLHPFGCFSLFFNQFLSVGCQFGPEIRSASAIRATYPQFTRRAEIMRIVFPVRDTVRQTREGFWVGELGDF